MRAPRTVLWDFGTSGAIDDVLSRVNNIASSATPSSTDIFAQYTCVGDGTIVGVSSRRAGTSRARVSVR